ncbi:MAG: hypothetical protein KKH41_04790 [Candidatus Thermoplasmatota archaeon]|nr:hypothetical protein [Euryarchaeota archaeon]MBU4031208.1 hypothetical protein [Candidatus Thermoplasmatota archaeon]MBU4070940.1 hypothetical protein [Candidatus Thermoplasmatota archaeon]MBU4144001.1 hypothetical protein [Candidatus Thermoplasmatota archaeon]MBU4591885.1 hypothetical protein [Candidatus Thermoplasmatota archaeon]
MTDEVEMLARRLRETPDMPMFIPDLASELGLTEPRMARGVSDLMKRDGFFDLGNNRLIFTGNSDLAAFEIFRTAALHISFEEFVHYRDQPHILMRLSRDREVACRMDTEKMLQNSIREKERTRGNTVF